MGRAALELRVLVSIASSIFVLTACGANSSISDPSDDTLPMGRADDAQQAGESNSLPRGADETGEVQSGTGDDYLMIVTPLNCALRMYSDVEAQYNAGDNTMDAARRGEMQQLMATTATARRAAASELLARVWPENVQAAVEQLSQWWFGLARLEEGLSLASSDTQWNAVMQEYNSEGSNSNLSGLPSIIRAKLGLPDNDVNSQRNLSC